MTLTYWLIFIKCVLEIIYIRHKVLHITMLYKFAEKLLYGFGFGSGMGIAYNINDYVKNCNHSSSPKMR